MTTVLYFFKALAAIILSVFTISSTADKTVIGLTEGTPIEATEHEYKFDNDKLLIGAYCFDLNHTSEESVAEIKEAGLDFIVAGVNEQFLDLCDKYEIGVIASGYKLPSTYRSEGDKWLHIDENSVAAWNNHSSIWGIDMIDEPNIEHFDGIAKAVDNFYELADGYMPLVNLFPMQASAEQLKISSTVPQSKIDLPLIGHYYHCESEIERYRRYVSEYINKVDTDYISFDLYPLEKNADGSYGTAPCWLRNLDILSEACRETGRDLWAITQVAGQPSKAGTGVTYQRETDLSDIRWQTYVSLSFGAKAIIHACYDSGWWDRSTHMIDSNGNKTESYTAVQTVNNEVEIFSDIYGNYQNHGAFISGNGIDAAGLYKLGLPIHGLIPVEEQYKPVVVSANPVLVGCFSGEDGSSAYTFVNMTERQLEKNAKATVVFDGEKEITVYQKGVAATTTASSISLDLDPCEGVFVTVK